LLLSAFCSVFSPPPHSFFVHCDCICIAMVTNEWLFNLPISGSGSLVFKIFRHCLSYTYAQTHTLCPTGNTIGAWYSYFKQNLFTCLFEWDVSALSAVTMAASWTVCTDKRSCVLPRLLSARVSCQPAHLEWRQRHLHPGGFLPNSRVLGVTACSQEVFRRKTVFCVCKS